MCTCYHKNDGLSKGNVCSPSGVGRKGFLVLGTGGTHRVSNHQGLEPHTTCIRYTWIEFMKQR